MVKMVNVVLCAFYHNRKNGGKKIVTVSNNSDRSKTSHSKMSSNQKKADNCGSEEAFHPEARGGWGEGKSDK